MGKNLTGTGGGTGLHPGQGMQRRLWRHHRRALLAGSAVAALAASSTAWAADPATDTAPATGTNATTVTSMPNALEEITVTATRRSENISKVPVNVTAYTQEQMDDQSIRQMDDIARLTPDIQFTHTAGVAGNNASDISIRGISSDVGAATTGIYIDDTPIQVRNVGYWGGNAYPKIFDLDRVEVLRGPQGTLFGAGAEGGVVRFLTPQPDLDEYSGYLKTELSDTINGDPSYETGAAVGGPIIKDQLGFRVSAWGRRDGGYIDRVSPDTGATEDANSNYQQSGAAKAALTWQPFVGLKITPTIYYQDIYSNDRDQYWETLSHPYADEFKSASRIGQPSDDRFSLPTLKIQYDLPNFSIFSNTSIFNRKQTLTLDYTNYLSSLFYGNPYEYSAAEGDIPSEADVTINQHSLTQELRLQSTTPDALVDWTAGAFYSWTKQQESDLSVNGQHDFTTLFGGAFAGIPLVDGRYGQVQYLNSYDEQISGYGSADLNVTDKLKLTAGLRISSMRYNFNELSEGPVNGGTTYVSGAQHEVPITPKFGASYQLDADNFIYATAAKGFRPGGAQAEVPTAFCAADLQTLGLTTSPTSYNSDSLWSYELGAKDSLMGGRLKLDSSVYLIKWDQIQQNVRLASCGYSYVANLGSATSVGGDISAKFAVTDSLRVGVSLGYNDTTADQTTSGGGNAILAVKGDRIGGPPLTATTWAEYEFRVLGDHEAFYRVDYSFHSHSPSVDSRTFGYDPGIASTKANGYLSMRVGVFVGGWEVSGFVNNLTNSETALSTAHDITGSPVYYESSYRPTTIGTSLEYRF